MTLSAVDKSPQLLVRLLCKLLQARVKTGDLRAGSESQIAESQRARCVASLQALSSTFYPPSGQSVLSASDLVIAFGGQERSQNVRQVYDCLLAAVRVRAETMSSEKSQVDPELLLDDELRLGLLVLLKFRSCLDLLICVDEGSENVRIRQELELSLRVAANCSHGPTRSSALLLGALAFRQCSNLTMTELKESWLDLCVKLGDVHSPAPLRQASVQALQQAGLDCILSGQVQSTASLTVELKVWKLGISLLQDDNSVLRKAMAQFLLPHLLDLPNSPINSDYGMFARSENSSTGGWWACTLTRTFYTLATRYWNSDPLALFLLQFLQLSQDEGNKETQEGLENDGKIGSRVFEEDNDMGFREKCLSRELATRALHTVFSLRFQQSHVTDREGLTLTFINLGEQALTKLEDFFSNENFTIFQAEVFNRVHSWICLLNVTWQVLSQTSRIRAQTWFSDSKSKLRLFHPRLLSMLRRTIHPVSTIQDL